MQTFLPLPSFPQSAACLDNRRLGKQRVEAKQILECLLNRSNLNWKNHPAVKMWRGHEAALARYGMTVCLEWVNRGFRDSLYPYFFTESINLGDSDMPPWFGKANFHNSHKSNLLRKDPEWYSKFNWPVTDSLNYVWPVR